MPSTIQSQTPPNNNALLIQSAADAVNVAALGKSCINELRAILRAVVSLSGDNEVIHGLAEVGLALADDRHNLLDCEHENMEQKLLVLNGASHV